MARSPLRTASNKPVSADAKETKFTVSLKAGTKLPVQSYCYDATGKENGDKCNFVFGPTIGGSLQNDNVYDFSGGGAP